MTDEEVRPRVGAVSCPHGRGEIAVRYESVPGSTTMFHPVGEDGESVGLHVTDALHVDVLGPGQGVEIEYEPVEVTYL